MHTDPTIVWRRLDLPGHEAAQLTRTAEGFALTGVVVLSHASRPCRMDYRISCDRGWHTRDCAVSGFVGDQSVAVEITRDAGAAWTVDGTPASILDGCDDVDLAFSPITNLLPIRRLALEIGRSARVRAAWLRFPELEMDVLEQVYTRLAPDRYLYESANGAFRRELTVDASGFVIDYPGLWIAESRVGEVLRG